MYAALRASGDVRREARSIVLHLEVEPQRAFDSLTRRTIQRRNKDGSVVRYLQLAHNVREPGRQPVAKVIHSFGREDRLDREALARLHLVELMLEGDEQIDWVAGYSALEVIEHDLRARDVDGHVLRLVDQ